MEQLLRPKKNFTKNNQISFENILIDKYYYSEVLEKEVSFEW